eukprot:jgi/Orpsp1_1/1179677/evm.model.c7180000070302.2
MLKTNYYLDDIQLSYNNKYTNNKSLENNNCNDKYLENINNINNINKHKIVSNEKEKIINQNVLNNFLDCVKQ